MWSKLSLNSAEWRRNHPLARFARPDEKLRKGIEGVGQDTQIEQSYFLWMVLLIC